MTKELKIKLESVKHPEQEIRGYHYVMNMTDSELKKVNELKAKYSYKTTRELFSKLIENAQ